MLDLDHFKKVNDTLGHTAGDQALREVSRRLRATARSTDVVARYGGEEFALILPETTLAQGVMAAERLRAAVDGLVIEGAGGASRAITLSLGVAAFPEHTDQPDALLSRADAALYAAKRSGRNRVCAAGAEGPAAPAAAPGPTLEGSLERLRFLLSDDLESPLASVCLAARMLHEATDESDALRPMTSQRRRRRNASSASPDRARANRLSPCAGARSGCRSAPRAHRRRARGSRCPAC